MLELMLYVGSIIEKLNFIFLVAFHPLFILSLIVIYVIICSIIGIFDSSLELEDILRKARFKLITIIYSIILAFYIITPTTVSYYSIIGVHIGKEVLTNEKVSPIFDKAIKALDSKLDNIIKDNEMEQNKEKSTS